MLLSFLQQIVLIGSPWKYLYDNRITDNATLSGFINSYYTLIRYLGLAFIAITILIEIIRWGVNAHEPMKNMPGRRSSFKIIAWKLILGVIIVNFNYIYNLFFYVSDIIRLSIGQ